MVRALGSRKFIEGGKWYCQGRVHGETIACFRKFENEEFAEGRLAEGTCLKIFGPAGGCSLSARIPPYGRGYGLWRRFFFRIGNRTSNLFVTGRFRKILVEKKIRDMVTRFGP